MALTPTDNEISVAFENLSLISNSENASPTDYEPKILEAINEIRYKKKRPDTNAIFNYISPSEASNIDIKTVDSIIQNLIKRKVITNKKTTQGLDSFYILSPATTKGNENEQNQNEQNQLLTEDVEFENFLATLKESEESPHRSTTVTNDLVLDTTLVQEDNYSKVDFQIKEAIKGTPSLLNIETPAQNKELNELGSKKEINRQEILKHTEKKETYIEYNEENYKLAQIENNSKIEAKLSAIKSYVKCEIVSINDKLNVFSEKFNKKIKTFDNLTKTLDLLQQNISFLQSQLVSKDELIKSLMDTQTTVLETLSKNKQEKPSEEESENATNADDAVDDNRNNEEFQLQPQHKPITNQQIQNIDNTPKDLNSTPKRLFIGNLNPDVTENDLNDLFGLKKTKYLCQTCSIQMPIYKNTGKSKGFAFLTLPSHISDAVKELDGIQFQNFKIKIEEAKLRSAPVSQNKNQHETRPQVVVNRNPENQHLLSTRPKVYPGEKSYAETTTSPSNKPKTDENIAVFGDSLLNFGKNTKNEINRKLTGKGRAKFKYFPGATSKDLLCYIDSTLEERKFVAAVIHIGTNDILNNGEDAVSSLLENIRKIAKKCESYGIQKILISGLIFTTRYSENILIHFNTLLKNICDLEGYFYIDNGNITRNELFRDGLHLLENGKQLLAQNFVTNVVNSFLTSRMFHPNVHIYGTLV